MNNNKKHIDGVLHFRRFAYRGGKGMVGLLHSIDRNYATRAAPHGANIRAIWLREDELAEADRSRAVMRDIVNRAFAG